MLSLSLCRNMMLACRSTSRCSVFTLIKSSWCRCDVNPIMGSGVSGPKPPTSRCPTVSLYFSALVKVNLVILNILGRIFCFNFFFIIFVIIFEKCCRLKNNNFIIHNICFYIHIHLHYIYVNVFNIVKTNYYIKLTLFNYIISITEFIIIFWFNLYL